MSEDLESILDKGIWQQRGNVTTTDHLSNAPKYFNFAQDECGYWTAYFSLDVDAVVRILLIDVLYFKKKLLVIMFKDQKKKRVVLVHGDHGSQW